MKPFLFLLLLLGVSLFVTNEQPSRREDQHREFYFISFYYVSSQRQIASIDHRQQEDQTSTW